MKITEFRKLIREEVRKVLVEVAVKVPSDGIVRDHKGKPQVQFIKKGAGTEVKSLKTGKTFMSPMSVDQAYTKLFNAGQIFGNDGSSFNGKMHKTFNDDFNDLDPSDWKRFLTASKEAKAKYKVGQTVDDLNGDEPFKVAKVYPNKAAALADIKKKISPQAFRDMMEEVESMYDNYRAIDKEDDMLPWYVLKSMHGDDFDYPYLNPEAYVFEP